MAFDPCGELWSLGEVVAGGIGLVRINTDSGSANLIGTGYESIHGLAAYEGRLITVSSGSANNPAAFEIDRHNVDTRGFSLQSRRSRIEPLCRCGSSR